MPKLPRALVTLLAIACATSCGGSTSPVDPGSDSSGPIAPGPPPTPDPSVTVSASALSLGAVAAEASIMLRNPGTDPVTWTHEATAPWVSATPGAGTLAGGGSIAVRIEVRREGLDPGVHAGRLRFVVGGDGPEVEVTLEVPPHASAMAEISPSSLALGIEESSAMVYVTNAGGGTLTWSLRGPAWVALDPASGNTAPGATIAVAVTPDRAALADGTHAGTLTFASDGGAGTVALSVAVASPAKLAVSPAKLDLGAGSTSAEVTITNAGGRPLSWTGADDVAWLAASSSSGTVAPHSTSAVSLTADRAGLAPGAYTATFAIESAAGAASVGVSMTVPAPSPPPPAPPPPPPPPASGVALAGRVVDQFDGHGVAGLTVRFAGETVTTDGSGRFSVPGSSSGSLRELRLSGSDAYPRTTFARSSDSQWRIVPGSFDMAAFDDLARDYEPRTIRWMSSPSIYIDTRPDEFAGGLELERWIDEVENNAAGFVSAWTGGRVGAGSVTVGSSPPPDGTPGVIVIHFSEDDSRYGSPSTVGLARTFWSGDRSIASGVVWLRFVRYSGPSNAGIRRAVLGHELGHALGMGHMNGGTPSLMTPNVSSSSLTAFDGRAGLLLYTRSPGNTSPDVDNAATYRGALAPSRAPGAYDWVCGGAEEP